MDWSLWTMFVLTEAALSATPGPAVLLVVSHAIRGGAVDSWWCAAGILAVNGVFFAVSGTSVGAMLATSERLFGVVEVAGAAYLVYLGGKALLAPPAPCGPLSHHGETRRELFARGAILQLSNPKALLFFMAILPQFIDRSNPVGTQLVVFGVTSMGLEALILAAYGAAAARTMRIALRGRLAVATGRLGGFFLVSAGLALLGWRGSGGRG